MPLNAKFHLQGVCWDSRADSFYLLKPGGWFEGFIQSRLVFSPARARWEILDSLDQGVVASLNHSQDYPLGQYWGWRRFTTVFSVVHSHWSRLNEAFYLLLAGSLWHKDSWFPCTESSYNRRPYAIKNQQVTTKIP